MLKVNILNLNEGENILDYVLSAADFELDKDLFKNNININITLVKSLSQLALNINFEYRDSTSYVTDVSMNMNTCVKAVLTLFQAPACKKSGNRGRNGG